MKIFIIGYMGSGKSTFGRKLSRRLNCPFVDMDKVFQLQFNSTISNYFEKQGEEAFRREEMLLLRQYQNQENLIISTGGGTPCFYDNMEWMNDNGLTIYLEMSPAALFSRLKNAKTVRPLLPPTEDFISFITTHLAKRAPYYSAAQITLNGLSISIDQVILEIEKHLAKQ